MDVSNMIIYSYMDNVPITFNRLSIPNPYKYIPINMIIYSFDVYKILQRVQEQDYDNVDLMSELEEFEDY